MLSKIIKKRRMNLKTLFLIEGEKFIFNLEVLFMFNNIYIFLI